jgi:hypothetical protein
MKKIIIVQIVLFLLAACEKSALTTASDSISRPVVEAYLSPGQTSEVKITYQLAFGSTDTLVQPIQDLNVTIEADGVVHPLFYSAIDSTYLAEDSWQVEAGKTYRLRFSFNGSQISAETTIPQQPEQFSASATTIAIPQIGNPGSGEGMPNFPDPIELSWSNTDGAYYLVVVENLESNPEAIFEVTDGNRPPRPTFRSEPEQNSSFEVGFQNFTYYGQHQVVLYRLNAEYASLYDDNGNSSQNLTTPYSNIVGGLGIFTGLNADTLMIKVTK